MNRDVEFIVFAAAALYFAAITLVALLVLGDHDTRSLALVGAFLGMASQFVGSEARQHIIIYRASIALAYAAMASTAAAIVTFAF